MTDESMSGSRGWNIPRKNSKKFRNWAIVAALVGLLCASEIGAIGYIVSMISVIGIPLAFVIVAIPTVCLLIVLAYAVFRLTGLKGLTGQIMAFAAAAGILVVYPPVHNAEINWRVAQLQRNDTALPPGGSQQLVSPSQMLGLMRDARDRRICDTFCIHLLITRQVSAVALSRLEDNASAPSFDEPANIFRLVSQSPCEMRNVRVNSIDQKARKGGTVTDRFLDMVDKGYCIAFEEGVISDADRIAMAISTSDFAQPSTISPLASTIKASRTALYAKTSTGGFAALHQQTPVTYSLLGPVLVHTFSGGHGLSVEASWWRNWYRAENRIYNERDYLRETPGMMIPEKFR